MLIGPFSGLRSKTDSGDRSMPEAKDGAGFAPGNRLLASALTIGNSHVVRSQAIPFMTAVFPPHVGKIPKMPLKYQAAGPTMAPRYTATNNGQALAVWRVSR